MANELNFFDSIQSNVTGTGAKSQGSAKSGVKTNTFGSNITNKFEDFMAQYSRENSRTSAKSSDRTTSNKQRRYQDSRSPVRVHNVNSINNINSFNNTSQAQDVSTANNYSKNDSSQELSESEQDGLQENLDRLLEDIENLTQTLSNSSDPNATKLGDFLARVAGQLSQLSQQSDQLDFVNLREGLAQLVADFDFNDLVEGLSAENLMDFATLGNDLLDMLDMFDAVDFTGALELVIPDLNASDILDAPIMGEAVTIPENYMPEEDIAPLPFETAQVEEEQSSHSGEVASSTDAIDNSDKDDNNDEGDDDAIAPQADVNMTNMVAPFDSPLDLSDINNANSPEGDALAIDSDGGNKAIADLLDRLTARREARVNGNANASANANNNVNAAAQRVTGLNSNTNEDEPGQGFDTNSRGSGQGSHRGTRANRLDGDEPTDGTLERPTRANVNARADFQSFFESVLAARKFSSREAQAPLNLQQDPLYDYTQSETLRIGLTNVVRFVRAQGEHRANIIVDPPAIGRVTVELTTSTSGVEASVKVASEQVRQLVQDQVVQLRMSLEQQGVQLAHFTVDVQQDDGRGQQQGGGQEQRRQGRRIAGIHELDEDEVQEEFRVDLEQGLLYWIA